MYSKIAINNVKKSFKDYTIYFLTIAFAVSIFYSFNSIGAQQAVIKINNSTEDYIGLIQTLMSVLSVFVSFILGGLILYANNFLIKKRKKELGIYMTLGMSKGKISKILLFETLIVGILSLVVGLLLGLLASQGLSVFTAKLFEADMAEFKFIVSGAAILKTILYFTLIFGILMIFNTRIVSKYKLIDMLNAGRKNEEIKIKSPIVSSIIFVFSASILIIAYYLVTKSGLNPTDFKFKASIVLGIIGTVGVFFGVSGFLLGIIQKSKSIYFKKLNIFVTRQLSSKVNTNFISMAVISLMLFVTIVTLSTGLGFKNAVEAGIVAPFDASTKLFTDETSKYQSVEDIMKKVNHNFNDDKYIFFNGYNLNGVEIADILKPYAVGEMKKRIDAGKERWGYVDAIKISDYNKIRDLYGEKALSINNNEVLVLSNYENAKESIKNLIKAQATVDINGKEYKVANTEYLNEAIYNSSIADNTLTLVVPDGLTENMELRYAYMDVNYSNPNDPKEEANMIATFDAINGRSSQMGNFNSDRDSEDLSMLPTINTTKHSIYADNKGMTTIILYVALYLGIVFLISSAAVLALQQLSEASDGSDRYKALKKIGATEKMINKTIFKQTVIYFAMPLILAIISSVVGINVVNKFLSLYGKSNIVPTSLLTLGILIVVYGGYFYVTYTGYKGIIKNSK